MEIIAVDTDRDALEALVAGVKTLYPQYQVSAFTDPLLAIQYGFNCGDNILYTALELKRASGFEVARLFRRAHGAGCVVHFIARDEKLRRDSINFGAASYTVKPVTAEKLRASQQETPERTVV